LKETNPSIVNQHQHHHHHHHHHHHDHPPPSLGMKELLCHSLRSIKASANLSMNNVVWLLCFEASASRFFAAGVLQFR
jgi:hypothetical protein